MRRHKKWSACEIDFLRENIGSRRMSYIADRLGRTEMACIVKAKRIGCGAYKDNTGLITVSNAAELLNVNRKTVYVLIQKKKLKCFRKNIRNHAYQCFLSYDDVICFADKYQKQAHKKWTAYEVSRLKMLLLRDLTQKQMAERLGTSENAVRNKIKRLSLQSEQLLKQRTVK